MIGRDMLNRMASYRQPAGDLPIHGHGFSAFTMYIFHGNSAHFIRRRLKAEMAVAYFEWRLITQAATLRNHTGMSAFLRSLSLDIVYDVNGRYFIGTRYHFAAMRLYRRDADTTPEAWRTRQ